MTNEFGTEELKVNDNITIKVPAEIKEKIKVSDVYIFPEPGSEYYEIKYKEVGEEEYKLGYGSVSLEEVRRHIRGDYIIVKEEENMNDASKNIPLDIKKKLCEECECQATCSKTQCDDCERMFAKYQKMIHKFSVEEILKMSSIELYRACVSKGVKGARIKQSRDYYISQLYENGWITYETLVELSNGAVNKGRSPMELISPTNDEEKSMIQGEKSADVIDEMIILFGIADVITFCRLNAWAYRKKSSYNGNTEYAEEADRYIKIAHELQQNRDYRGDWKQDCIPDRS